MIFKQKMKSVSKNRPSLPGLFLFLVLFLVLFTSLANGQVSSCRDMATLKTKPIPFKPSERTVKLSLFETKEECESNSKRDEFIIPFKDENCIPRNFKFGKYVDRKGFISRCSPVVELSISDVEVDYEPLGCNGGKRKVVISLSDKLAERVEFYNEDSERDIKKTIFQVLKKIRNQEWALSFQIFLMHKHSLKEQSSFYPLSCDEFMRRNLKGKGSILYWTDDLIFKEKGLDVLSQIGPVVRSVDSKESKEKSKGEKLLYLIDPEMMKIDRKMVKVEIKNGGKKFRLEKKHPLYSWGQHGGKLYVFSVESCHPLWKDVSFAECTPWTKLKELHDKLYKFLTEEEK